MNTELPCDKTGKGCRWVWCCDPDVGEEGYCCGEMYCLDCYRSREWELKEFEAEEENHEV